MDKADDPMMEQDASLPDACQDLLKDNCKSFFNIKQFPPEIDDNCEYH